MRPILALSALAVIAAGTVLAAASTPGVPTFSKHVAPILYKRCLECHRPGEAGPMSFRTYKEARPWANAIKEDVAKRVMPPWHADPSQKHFSHDRSLGDA